MVMKALQGRCWIMSWHWCLEHVQHINRLAGRITQTLEHWQFLNWAISNRTSSLSIFLVFHPSISENIGKPWSIHDPSNLSEFSPIFSTFSQHPGREISDAWLEELRSPAGASSRAPHARVEKVHQGGFRKLSEFTRGFHQEDIAESWMFYLPSGNLT